MAKPYSYMIQIRDTDIEPMIKEMAAEDMRTIGNQTAYLIRKEYNARQSKSVEPCESHTLSMTEKSCK